MPVYLGDCAADSVEAQLYAEPTADEPRSLFQMQSIGPVPGAVNGVLFQVRVHTRRPAAHFTVRLVPHHPHALVPQESNRIHWLDR